MDKIYLVVLKTKTNSSVSAFNDYDKAKKHIDDLIDSQLKNSPIKFDVEKYEAPGFIPHVIGFNMLDKDIKVKYVTLVTCPNYENSFMYRMILEMPVF